VLNALNFSRETVVNYILAGHKSSTNKVQIGQNMRYVVNRGPRYFDFFILKYGIHFIEEILYRYMVFCKFKRIQSSYVIYAFIWTY
jgi:hypothetical protein